MDTLSYSTRSTLLRLVAVSSWEALRALGRRSAGHPARPSASRSPAQAGRWRLAAVVRRRQRR